MKIKRRSSITYDTGIDLQKNCNGLTDSRLQQLNMWRNALFHTISRSWIMPVCLAALMSWNWMSCQHSVSNIVIMETSKHYGRRLKLVYYNYEDRMWGIFSRLLLKWIVVFIRHLKCQFAVFFASNLSLCKFTPVTGTWLKLQAITVFCQVRWSDHSHILLDNRYDWILATFSPPSVKFNEACVGMFSACMSDWMKCLWNNEFRRN